MRKFILAASAVSILFCVPLAGVASAQNTTVIKKDNGLNSKTTIKKDTPYGDKKVIIKKNNEQ